MDANETLPKSTLTFEFLPAGPPAPLARPFAMTPVNAKLSVKESDDRRRRRNACRCHSLEAALREIARLVFAGDSAGRGGFGQDIGTPLDVYTRFGSGL